MTATFMERLSCLPVLSPHGTGATTDRVAIKTTVGQFAEVYPFNRAGSK